MPTRFRLPSLLPFLIALGACAPDIEPVDDPSTPALVAAAERGDLKSLDALLAGNAAPDVRDLCEWTPLMKAALNGHEPAVRRLLDAGAAVDAADKGGYTALMLAASNNHAQTVRLLSAAGADPNHAEPGMGWTALIWSAKQGHAEAVQALLAAGADPSLTDNSGRSAKDWARENQHAAILKLLL